MGEPISEFRKLLVLRRKDRASRIRFLLMQTQRNIANNKSTTPPAIAAATGTAGNFFEVVETVESLLLEEVLLPAEAMGTAVPPKTPTGMVAEVETNGAKVAKFPD